MGRLMDSQTDIYEQTDRRQGEGQTDEWTDRQMKVYTNTETCISKIDRRMDVETDIGTNRHEWNEKIDRWTNRQMNKYIWWNSERHHTDRQIKGCTNKQMNRLCKQTDRYE